MVWLHIFYTTFLKYQLPKLDQCLLSWNWLKKVLSSSKDTKGTAFHEPKLNHLQTYLNLVAFASILHQIAFIPVSHYAKLPSVLHGQECIFQANLESCDSAKRNKHTDLDWKSGEWCIAQANMQGNEGTTEQHLDGLSLTKILSTKFNSPE